MEDSQQTSPNSATVNRSSVERRLMYGCGFPPFRSVDGKRDIQHIVQNTQSGIYVLAHKDGTYYVGLSVNVAKRFEQHVPDKRPIAAFTFRKVHKTILGAVESEIIALLEDMGVRLTNTEKMKPSIGGASRSAATISPDDLNRWLTDDSWNDLSGMTPDAPRPFSNIEDRYSSEFLHKPYAHDILDFYSEYVRRCIFKPLQTAPDKWNVTCLPRTKYMWENKKLPAVSLINAGSQYVVLIVDDHGSLVVSLAAKKSVFERTSSLARLQRLAPSARVQPTSVTALGDDQVEIVVLLAEAKALLEDRGLISAVRAIVVHNRGMNQSGSSIFKRYHCFAFAKDIFRGGRASI